MLHMILGIRKMLHNLELALKEFRKSLFPDCIRKWNELPVDLWKTVKLDDFMNKITFPLK